MKKTILGFTVAILALTLVTEAPAACLGSGLGGNVAHAVGRVLGVHRRQARREARATARAKACSTGNCSVQAPNKNAPATP